MCFLFLNGLMLAMIGDSELIVSLSAALLFSQLIGC
jgi:hypothetical protein